MSIQALTSAMAIRGVTPSEKLLLLALANYADENMRCYPSQRRLSEDTSLSDRTIRSLLAGLQERGLLSRQERVRADKSRASDIITLHLTASTEVTQISGGGETISGGVGKPLPGGGEMVSGLTTFEPSLNHSGSEEPSSKRRASKRCPAEWFPKPDTVAVLASEGYAAGDLERALTMMKDHQYRDAHTDWDAAYRNWVRKGHSIRPQSGQANDQRNPDQRQLARYENYAAALRGAERVTADG